MCSVSKSHEMTDKEQTQKERNFTSYHSPIASNQEAIETKKLDTCLQRDIVDDLESMQRQLVSISE